MSESNQIRQLTVLKSIQIDQGAQNRFDYICIRKKSNISRIKYFESITRKRTFY